MVSDPFMVDGSYWSDQFHVSVFIAKICAGRLPGRAVNGGM